MTISARPLGTDSASQGVARTAKPNFEFDGAGSGFPPSEDFALFQKTFQSLPSPVGRVAKLSKDPTLLGELSDYLSGRRGMASHQLSGILSSRDPAAMIEVAREMSDQAIEQDLLVKVIGKTVSSIDQLTKLN
jgi:nitrogen regulatory protein PII-like uncharacterized protein